MPLKLRTQTPLPRRCLLYGTHGIGKTTWASKLPSPLFVPTEDGLPHDVSSFSVAKTPKEFTSNLSDVLNEEHNFKTLVVDSADWLERLMASKIAADNGVPNLGDIPYGRGTEKLVVAWNHVLGILEQIRSKGMAIIMLGHAQIKRFESPDASAYDRYQPRMADKTSHLIQEWCDEVLFVNYQVVAKKEKGKFGNERGIGIGDGERIVRTQERPAWVAKNRLALPLEIEFSPEAYTQHWPELARKDQK